MGRNGALLNLPGYLRSYEPLGVPPSGHRIVATFGVLNVLFVSAPDGPGAQVAARDLMAMFRPLPGRTITIEEAGDVVRRWSGDAGSWAEHGS